MRLAIISCAALLVTGSPAAAGFVDTFSEWQRLSRSDKTSYIAGAFDSWIVLGTTAEDQVRAKHFSSCVSGAKMTLGQITTNLEVFAAARPDLHAVPPQAALIQYLIQVCGPS